MKKEGSLGRRKNTYEKKKVSTGFLSGHPSSGLTRRVDQFTSSQLQARILNKIDTVNLLGPVGYQGSTLLGLVGQHGLSSVGQQCPTTLGLTEQQNPTTWGLPPSQFSWSGWAARPIIIGYGGQTRPNAI
jgi:hypothetical protein